MLSSIINTNDNSINDINKIYNDNGNYKYIDLLDINDDKNLSIQYIEGLLGILIFEKRIYQVYVEKAKSVAVLYQRHVIFQITKIRLLPISCEKLIQYYKYSLSLTQEEQLQLERILIYLHSIPLYYSRTYDLTRTLQDNLYTKPCDNCISLKCVKNSISLHSLYLLQYSDTEYIFNCGILSNLLNNNNKYLSILHILPFTLIVIAGYIQESLYPRNLNNELQIFYHLVRLPIHSTNIANIFSSTSSFTPYKSHPTELIEHEFIIYKSNIKNFCNCLLHLNTSTINDNNNNNNNDKKEQIINLVIHLLPTFTNVVRIPKTQSIQLWIYKYIFKYKMYNIKNNNIKKKLTSLEFYILLQSLQFRINKQNGVENINIYNTIESKKTKDIEEESYIQESMDELYKKLLSNDDTTTVKILEKKKPIINDIKSNTTIITLNTTKKYILKHHYIIYELDTPSIIHITNNNSIIFKKLQKSIIILTYNKLWEYYICNKLILQNSIQIILKKYLISIKSIEKYQNIYLKKFPQYTLPIDCIQPYNYITSDTYNTIHGNDPSIFGKQYKIIDNNTYNTFVSPYLLSTTISFTKPATLYSHLTTFYDIYRMYCLFGIYYDAYYIFHTWYKPSWDILPVVRLRTFTRQRYPCSGTRLYVQRQPNIEFYELSFPLYRIFYYNLLVIIGLAFVQ